MRTVVAMAVILASARAAAGDGLVVRHTVEEGVVVAVVRAPELVDAELRRRLRSGLANRFVYDAELEAEGSATPLYRVRRTVRVVYDLWDEYYLVEARGGGPSEVRRLQTLAEVVRLLQGPVRIQLGTAARCRPGARYRADVRLRVNPVTSQVLERSRELLASPVEGPGESSRSLLGSAARIFLNIKPDPGVRVLRGLSHFAVVRPSRAR